MVTIKVRATADPDSAVTSTHDVRAAVRFALHTTTMSRRAHECLPPALQPLRSYQFTCLQLEALVWNELDTVTTLAARLQRGHRMLPSTFASYRPPPGYGCSANCSQAMG